MADEAMTVAELRRLLDKFDDDVLVWATSDGYEAPVTGASFSERDESGFPGQITLGSVHWSFDPPRTRWVENDHR